MKNYCKAKRTNRVPNIVGVFTVLATALVGKIIEDIEITCGNCDHDWTSSFRTQDSTIAKCPCCGFTNSFKAD